MFSGKKPTGLEVVLTGRDPDLRLVEKADYVSEICKVKHLTTGESGLEEGLSISRARHTFEKINR